MRRKDKEVSELEQIEEIINGANICRLGLYDNGKVYIVPMSFGYANRKLYFHSAKEGRKIEILKSNPNVGFEIDIDLGLVSHEVACDWSNKFKSVIGIGQASFVEDSNQKITALNIIMQNYSDAEFQFPEGALSSTLVFMIDIEEMTGKQSI